MSQKKYDSKINIDDLDMTCCKCNLKLELGPVMLEYLGNGFPIDLPKCPKCNQIFIPEDLALGKILHVEKSLEDK